MAAPSIDDRAVPIAVFDSVLDKMVPVTNVSGTPDYRRTGQVLTRTRVEFPSGVKYLRVTPRAAGNLVDVNTGISADVDAAVAAASGLRLMGYSVRESAAVAAATTVRLVHGATVAGGTEIAVIELAANEEKARWFEGGIACANGISVDLAVAGTVDIDLYYRLPGVLKIVINADSTAIADSFLASPDSLTFNMMHRQVWAGDTIELSEFEYQNGITIVDMLGDAGISAVDVMGV